MAKIGKFRYESCKIAAVKMAESLKVQGFCGYEAACFLSFLNFKSMIGKMIDLKK